MPSPTPSHHLHHLLVPAAAQHSDGCRAALATLRLPHLERLLNRLAPAAPDSGPEDSLSPPHERALARHHGLACADGCIPWAALEAETPPAPHTGSAWATITPCHWQVQADHIVMAPPATLQLEEAESQALLQAMQPFFTEDGIPLQYAAPTRWLARGDIFRQLPTAAIDRVLGHNVDEWMPPTAQGGPLRRLQSEMQMLLYTHPVNDARAARGLLPVNSFWVSGTGALADTPPLAPPRTPPPTQPLALLHAAQAGDWAQWASAWQHIDATDCAALLAALDQGQPVQLTLCGARSAQSFHSHKRSAPRSLLQKISGLLGRQRISNVLEQL